MTDTCPKCGCVVKRGRVTSLDFETGEEYDAGGYVHYDCGGSGSTSCQTIAALRDQLTTAALTNQDQRNEYEHTVCALRAERDALLLAADRLHRDAAALRAELKQANEVGEEMGQELDALRAELAVERADRNKWRDECKPLRAEVERLEKALRTVEPLIERHAEQRTKNAIRKHIAGLKASVAGIHDEYKHAYRDALDDAVKAIDQDEWKEQQDE